MAKGQVWVLFFMMRVVKSSPGKPALRIERSCPALYSNPLYLEARPAMNGTKPDQATRYFELGEEGVSVWE